MQEQHTLSIDIDYYDAENLWAFITDLSVDPSFSRSTQLRARHLAHMLAKALDKYAE